MYVGMYVGCVCACVCVGVDVCVCRCVRVGVNFVCMCVCTVSTDRTHDAVASIRRMGDSRPRIARVAAAGERGAREGRCIVIREGGGEGGRCRTLGAPCTFYVIQVPHSSRRAVVCVLRLHIATVGLLGVTKAGGCWRMGDGV